METITLQLSEKPYDKKATIYHDPAVAPKGALLYFHGGGLLYGNREDLPELHQEKMTGAGYIIVAFDYPLAPIVKLDGILPDVIASINGYQEVLAQAGLPSDLPYFVWGRSAGAYLSLIASASDKLTAAPAGIVSYYGYGFLVDHWYDQPSDHYNTLAQVPEACLNGTPDEAHCYGPLDTHYSVYVYARQQGKWKELIYEGREKFFFIDYSLRLKDTLPAPLFCAHSVGDTDVPFDEFNALAAKYAPVRFVAAAGEHDFDRHTEDPFTEKLLNETIEFMNGCL